MASFVPFYVFKDKYSGLFGNHPQFWGDYFVVAFVFARSFNILNLVGIRLLGVPICLFSYLRVGTNYICIINFVFTLVFVINISEKLTRRCVFLVVTRNPPPLWGGFIVVNNSLLVWLRVRLKLSNRFLI